MSILNYIFATGNSAPLRSDAAERRYWPWISPRCVPPRKQQPNPAGTKLARKAAERKLGLRWC
jgi:hypothetical protein